MAAGHFHTVCRHVVTKSSATPDSSSATVAAASAALRRPSSKVLRSARGGTAAASAAPRPNEPSGLWRRAGAAPSDAEVRRDEATEPSGVRCTGRAIAMAVSSGAAAADPLTGRALHRPDDCNADGGGMVG